MSMKQKLTKVLLSFLTFTVLFSSVFTKAIFAQQLSPRDGTWYNPTLNQFLNKVGSAAENEIFGERYTFAQVAWIVHSLYFLLAGPASDCADNGSAAQVAQCLGGALNQAGNNGLLLPLAFASDSLMQTRPASGIDYVAGKLEKFDLVDSAYAQTPGGFGYANSLAIIQPLWLGVRDASYSLVIFAILILAFMVMLRAKISPQASITVQSALPRIAIGLIMITFSYAIAGFMVDLIFVAQGLIAGILTSSALSNGNAIDVFIGMNTILASMFSYVLLLLLVIFTLGTNDPGVAGVLLSNGAGFLAGVVVLIILVIVMAIALFKILALQLRTFTAIILLVIVSPLMMLVGIIRGGTIGNWLKSLFANLVVFLAISVLVLLSHLLLISSNSGWLGAVATEFDKLGISWLPTLNPFKIVGSPVVEGGQFPTNFGFGNVGVIGLVLSLGVFVSIPSLAKGARDYIMSGKGNFSLGEATALGAAGLGGAYGLAKQGVQAYDAPAAEMRERAWGTLRNKVMSNAATTEEINEYRRGVLARGLMKKFIK